MRNCHQYSITADWRIIKIKKEKSDRQREEKRDPFKRRTTIEFQGMDLQKHFVLSLSPRSFPFLRFLTFSDFASLPWYYLIFTCIDQFVYRVSFFHKNQ